MTLFHLWVCFVMAGFFRFDIYDLHWILGGIFKEQHLKYEPQYPNIKNKLPSNSAHLQRYSCLRDFLRR